MKTHINPENLRLLVMVTEERAVRRLVDIHRIPRFGIHPFQISERIGIVGRFQFDAERANNRLWCARCPLSGVDTAHPKLHYIAGAEQKILVIELHFLIRIERIGYRFKQLYVFNIAVAVRDAHIVAHCFFLIPCRRGNGIGRERKVIPPVSIQKYIFCPRVGYGFRVNDLRIHRVPPTMERPIFPFRLGIRQHLAALSRKIYVLGKDCGFLFFREFRCAGYGIVLLFTRSVIIVIPRHKIHFRALGGVIRRRGAEHKRKRTYGKGEHGK